MKRLLVLPVVGLAVLLGCTRPPAKVVTIPPPEVIVSYPVVKDVTDYEDFTGRTSASQTVNVISYVTGYVKEVKFKDGDDVKIGSPLFEIDDRVYEAEFQRAKAAVVQAEAKLHTSEVEFYRMRGEGIRIDIGTMLAREGRTMRTKLYSPVEVNTITGNFLEALAAVQVAKRQMESAEISLKYCKIVSPIEGKISRRNLDKGNLVMERTTLLANIVAINPIYAEFDVDDRTSLRGRRLVEAGLIQSFRQTEIVVEVGLPDEEGFSLKGIITFVDNQFNPGTGTIRVRAEVLNPTKLLSPGMFLRVRVPIGKPKREILVPEVAIGTDQGLKFVYVVDENDEVVKRRVELGLPVEFGWQKETYRVVKPIPGDPGASPIGGVKPTDRVIVKGLQRAREKAKVLPKREIEVAPAPRAIPQ